MFVAIIMADPVYYIILAYIEVKNKLWSNGVLL